jgi:AcrR family transcriptional regulator
VADTYHHGALAQAMVDEALREVRLHGSDDVSLRRIATTLRVSPSAAYNHFADKDALLKGVGQCGHDDLDQRMAHAAAAHRGSSDEEVTARFRSLGEAYIAFALDDPNLFRLTFGPLCFGEGDDMDSGPYQRLSESLDELDARGLLRGDIRESLDLAVWSAVHGLCVLVLEGAVPREAAPALLDTISRLVLAEPADVTTTMVE